MNEEPDFKDLIKFKLRFLECEDDIGLTAPKSKQSPNFSLDFRYQIHSRIRGRKNTSSVGAYQLASHKTAYAILENK